MSEHTNPITVGRYLLHRKIARGGMATIHIARLMGDVGFSRIVAAKRMHPELAEDKDFVSMFLDEARIASKVHHRNVVPVLDVVTMGEEVVLVQEYVHGAPLSFLLRTSCEQKTHVPVPVAAAIACQVLAGLHAAHEAVDETGTQLDIVHRDVSPQNIMVSTDGSARLLDFGVAKASVTAHVTRKGTFKGKLGYSSPEQIRGEANKQSDIYALGVVLWELLVGHRLHGNTHGEAQLIAEIINGTPPTVTEALTDEKSWVGSYRWSQLEALEPIIRKALDTNHRRRWASAADMEEAIAAAVPLASATDIAAWLRAVGKDFLESRDKMIAEEEASWRRTNAMSASGIQAVPSGQLSMGVATEPEGVPVVSAGGVRLRPDWYRRIPTALIAALVVMLVATVALLSRDLDSSEPKAGTAAAATEVPSHAPSAARVVPSPAATHTKTSKTHPVPAPPAVASEIRSAPKAELRDEREDRLEDPDPSERDKPDRDDSERSEPKRVVSQKRATTTKTASRTRPSKSETKKASAPEKEKEREKPSPPPPSKSSSEECGTPFYFKGNKKIFKPGCL